MRFIGKKIKLLKEEIKNIEFSENAIFSEQEELKEGEHYCIDGETGDNTISIYDNTGLLLWQGQIEDK